MSSLFTDLDSYGGGPPINDTAAPAVAASNINPYIAQGIGSALGGIGTGLGNALSGAFGPKPQPYYQVPPRQSALPIALAAGVGLLALVLILRKK